MLPGWIIIQLTIAIAAALGAILVIGTWVFVAVGTPREEKFMPEATHFVFGIGLIVWIGICFGAHALLSVIHEAMK